MAVSVDRSDYLAVSEADFNIADKALCSACVSIDLIGSDNGESLGGIAAADDDLVGCRVGLNLDGYDIAAVLRGSGSGRDVSCGELARPGLTLYGEVLVLVGCGSISSVLLVSSSPMF